jgi:RNA polymerase sigma-70 factor, ECF subfamily
VQGQTNSFYFHVGNIHRMCVAPERRHLYTPCPVREARVDFFAFDKVYLQKLREGDPATEHHFASYFGRFLRIRLRARRLPLDRIDDVVQETLLKVIIKVYQDAVRQPECFGSFVNSTCNNILQEHYRSDRFSLMNQPIEDGPMEVADKVLDLDGLLATQETAEHVRRILDDLPERDRRILRSLFFEEKDKDVICREFGVKRDYLRVLVLRAKDKFRALYQKDQNGNGGRASEQAV